MSIKVPRTAAGAWSALQDALEDQPSTPCRASRDPELWWQHATAEAAGSLCVGCPVVMECGRYADAAGERWGTWAGEWRGRGDAAS